MVIENRMIFIAGDHCLKFPMTGRKILNTLNLSVSENTVNSYQIFFKLIPRNFYLKDTYALGGALGNWGHIMIICSSHRDPVNPAWQLHLFNPKQYPPFLHLFVQ